jgi:ribosomal protein S18 acetylase RimI-like enzyme
MDIRNAEKSELDALARLWHDGWQDAHARISPPELKRVRTLESFRERLAAALPHTRVAGPSGAPAGFSIIKDDELYQLYVAAGSRGTGLAAELTADAEARLVANGVTNAWLACAVGNERAARFYEKSGWRRVATETYPAATADGFIDVDVWRYEKRLDRVGPAPLRVV